MQRPLFLCGESGVLADIEELSSQVRPRNDLKCIAFLWLGTAQKHSVPICLTYDFLVRIESVGVVQLPECHSPTTIPNRPKPVSFV